MKRFAVVILILALTFVFAAYAYGLDNDNTDGSDRTVTCVQVIERVVEVEKTVEVEVEKPVEVVKVVHHNSEMSGTELDEAIVYALAKAVAGEARGCDKMQQAAVVWAILNMTEEDGYEPDILGNLTYPDRVMGYATGNPTDEHKEIVRDVLLRYELEKLGVGDVGRVLPKGYTYWCGRDGINHFRNAYRGGDVWNWDCTNPYEQ